MSMAGLPRSDNQLHHTVSEWEGEPASTIFWEQFFFLQLLQEGLR